MIATPCDIVILDYMLGSEEGVAFARWLRNDPASPAPYAPIILVTGHADRPRIMAARDAGVNEFCAGAASDPHAGGSPGLDEEYHRFHRVKGGYVSVEVTPESQAAGGKITFRHHDVNGNVVYEKAFGGK